MSERKNPEPTAGEKARMKRLVARGVLKPPLKRRRAPASLPNPAGSISDDVMERLWQKEREGR